MNLAQMGVRYNVKGDLVNMTKEQQEKAMMNKKAMLKPLRKALWLKRQQRKAA